MAITVSLDIEAIMAIITIRAITANTQIRANCSKYNYYCQKRNIYVITAIKSIQIIIAITANAIITAVMTITAIKLITANLFIT